MCPRSLSAVTMIRILPRLAFVAVFLPTAAVLAGCARKTPDPVKVVPATVTFTKPVVRWVTDYEDFTGRTEPYRVAELKARVTGYLEGVYFKDGQDITEGKPLFGIDQRVYRAEYDRASAALHKAEKHYSTMGLIYGRAKLSYEKGTGGKEAYEIAAGELATAEADIGAAFASQELAETNLRFTRVYAPFDGRLSMRMKDPGNLVKADETLLTTIVQLDTLYATFDIDERTMTRFRELIKKGEIKSAREETRFVRIGTADDEESFPLSGQITFSDNQVDANTGTLRIRAEIRNPKLDKAPWFMLSPGQFIRVRLPVGNAREAILIPEKALATDQGQKYVFVLNANDEVERRNVRLGPQYGSFRVIEDKVLKLDDRVVVEGLLKVKPKVKVIAEPAAASKLPADMLAPIEVAPAPHSKS